MKKIISILTITAVIAFVMTSCKDGIATQQMVKYDTVGLAAFQQWKYQQYQEATSMQPVAPVIYKAPAKTKVVYRNKPASTTSGSMNSSSTHTAQTVTKKRTSKAVKGAVIGGAGGAILGAVINKRNRVAGGIIGGILGGGVGYGIGRSQDKKDGRY